MHGRTTKCICHKGFSGYASVVTRSNFRVGGQDTAPQSLTAHTLDRWASCCKPKNEHSYENNFNNIRTIYDN